MQQLGFSIGFGCSKEVKRYADHPKSRELSWSLVDSVLLRSLFSGLGTFGQRLLRWRSVPSSQPSRCRPKFEALERRFEALSFRLMGHSKFANIFLVGGLRQKPKHQAIDTISRNPGVRWTIFWISSAFCGFDPAHYRLLDSWTCGLMIADAGETSLTTKNELKQRERHLQVEEAISRSHVACCNDAKFVMSQSDATMKHVLVKHHQAFLWTKHRVPNILLNCSHASCAARRTLITASRNFKAPFWAQEMEKANI